MGGAPAKPGERDLPPTCPQREGSAPMVPKGGVGFAGLGEEGYSSARGEKKTVDDKRSDLICFRLGSHGKIAFNLVDG